MTAIKARDMHAADLWHRYNWDEHVVRAWPDAFGVAVVTAEFPGIVQHLELDLIVDVDRVGL